MLVLGTLIQPRTSALMAFHWGMFAAPEAPRELGSKVAGAWLEAAPEELAAEELPLFTGAELEAVPLEAGVLEAWLEEPEDWLEELEDSLLAVGLLSLGSCCSASCWFRSARR